MDINLIAKDKTFFKMVEITGTKLERCCAALGISIEQQFFGQTVGSSFGVGAGRKGSVGGTKKRKVSNKKVAKRPRTGGKKKSVAPDKA